MTTPRSNRIDSSGEYSSDFSDGYSSDDVSHAEIQPCVLTGNSGLLWDLSDQISTVWKQVGRKLEIKECIIENIDIDYERENDKEKAYQLLLTWTRQLGSKATLRELLNALANIGRNDVAKAIRSVSNRQQRSSVGSAHGTELEMKIHAKQQKQALRKLKQALQFYQQRLREAEDLQHRVFEEKEAREMKEELQELDKNIIQRKLDSLQEQILICSMQEKDQKYSELDQQLRIVADKLFELDKTFKKFNDTLDDLRVSYSKMECGAFGSLCYFRYIKFLRTSSSGKHSRTSSKGDERSSVGSTRATELEMKKHVELQRQALRSINKAWQFVQQRHREVEDDQYRDFEEKEARELVREIKEKLKELDIQRKLDSLQEQICSMQEKDQKCFELDQQLRIVADNLYEVDKMFNKFNDTLDGLRVSYSKIEEIDDEVFQDSPCQDPREHSESKTSPKHSFTRNTLSSSSLSKLFRSTQPRNKTSSRPHPHKGQEQHMKRKLSVSIIDIDEQFQLQDFVNKFCRRYRHDRPFIYSHCCMNRDLQGSLDQNVLRPRPLSCIDPNTLPNPCYQSTEAIMSLVTSPFGSHTPRGFINVTSDLV